MKKFTGDIIILHMCIKNHNHMMYGSWDTERDRQKILSFWPIFCPFSTLTTWKIKISTLQKKNPGDIITLHICTINENHMMYGSWDIESNRQYFVILDHFLPFYPPMDPENQNFQNGQNTWRYYHFTNVNDSPMINGSSDTECNRQNILSFWAIFCPFTP